LYLDNTSTHESEFGNSNLGKFTNLCLKIQMGKTTLEFFLVYLEVVNRRVIA
jgi:hypothetical protein